MDNKQLKGIDKKIHDMIMDELKNIKYNSDSLRTPEVLCGDVNKAVEENMKKLQEQISELKNKIHEKLVDVDKSMKEFKDDVRSTVDEMMETLQPSSAEVFEGSVLTTGIDVVSYQGTSVKPQVLTVIDDVVTVHNVVHKYTTEELTADDLKMFSLSNEGKYVFLLVGMPEKMALNKKHFQVTTVDIYGKEDTVKAGYATTDDGVSALMAVPVDDTVVTRTVKVYWNGTKDTGENVTTFHVSTSANSLSMLLK